MKESSCSPYSPKDDPIIQKKGSYNLPVIDTYSEIVDSYHKISQRYGVSESCQISTIDDDAKWVAAKTLQIIKTYLQKEMRCTLIAIKSWTNGVPNIFDCSYSAEDTLIFCDGFLNGYTEPDGVKIDIEMETRYSDAAIEGQNLQYIELLKYYTELQIHADTTLLLNKKDDNGLYLQIVNRQ